MKKENIRTFLDLSEFRNSLNSSTSGLKIFYKSQNEKVISLKTDIRPPIYDLLNHLEIDWLNQSSVTLWFTGQGQNQTKNWYNLLSDIIQLYDSPFGNIEAPKPDHSFQNSHLQYDWLFKNENHELADSEDEHIFYSISVSISSGRSEFYVGSAVSS